MSIPNKLQLTFIPPEYWNENFSKVRFKLLKASSKKPIPKTASFFFMWSPLIKSEKELEKEIKVHFPNIPANKLITCNIRLAIPNDDDGNFNLKLMTGKILPLPPALKLLFQLKIISNQDRSYDLVRHSNSIRTWAFLTKFIFELLNRGCFVPILEANENNYIGKWKLLLKTKSDNERFRTILLNSSWASFNLPINFIKTDTNEYKTDELWDPTYLFTIFMDNVGDYLIRSFLNKPKFKIFEDLYSIQLDNEEKGWDVDWDYKFLKTIILKENLYKIEKFSETIIPVILKNWAQNAQVYSLNREFTFQIELKYPKTPEDDWLLCLYIELLQDTNKRVPLDKIWDYLDRSAENSQLIEGIFRALGIASKIFSPIKQSLEEGLPSQITLSSSEVMEFLRYPKDLLIQSGFNIILPEAFMTRGGLRLSTRVLIQSSPKKKVRGASGATLPSMFAIDSMLKFKWEAEIEGNKLTENELKEMITTSEPLINWRGKWVLIDQQDLEDLQQIFGEKGAVEGLSKPQGEISNMEALQLGLTGNVQLQDHGPKYEVLIEGDFEEIVGKLQSIQSFKQIPVPKAFNGKLRPYQKEGLTWMANMSPFNFGLCLADDMGLGKTIQVIAFLLFLKEKYPDKPGSTLIICPTSVLFNWDREIKRFAPDLEVVLHHGSKRIKDADQLSEYLVPHKIILTSYGTLRNDIDFFETISFSGVILDESQNIKNYASKQTKAVFNLQSQYRICLSGTPIENRLLELWTLFEFLNPGLLGERATFQKKYIIPIERFQEEEATEKLRALITPFLLRRVKSDKNIISDLPDKNEMKIHIELSEAQVSLYTDLVETTLQEMKELTTDVKKKKGLVLKLLMQLKQICNHPYHYLKKPASEFEKNGKLLAQSNKLERLVEMTDEVITNGEKVLIFTQFRKMGDIIKKILEEKYNFEILYFHGSVPEKKRREIVDSFQSEAVGSPPVLILSLKAGGTGLNLTRGTTVIHFDRWWNPAVEDQATDRAYRIGQKLQVNVYKFISVGTIEEKIDKLLEEKRDLADKVVASTGESWISDLSEDKLRELFTLTN